MEGGTALRGATTFQRLTERLGGQKGSTPPIQQLPLYEGGQKRHREAPSFPPPHPEASLRESQAPPLPQRAPPPGLGGGGGGTAPAPPPPIHTAPEPLTARPAPSLRRGDEGWKGKGEGRAEGRDPQAAHPGLQVPVEAVGRAPDRGKAARGDPAKHRSVRGKSKRRRS